MKTVAFLTTCALLLIALVPGASAVATQVASSGWCGGDADAHCYYCSKDNSAWGSSTKYCKEDHEDYDPDYDKLLCSVWNGVSGRCVVGGGLIDGQFETAE